MDLMDSEEEHHKENHHKDKHRKCKYAKKHLNALPPRKSIKKLIFREMDTLAPKIFEQLMKCKEIG